ncbi:MAG: DUF4430 domain-containing protein [Ruminococcaceae bacterium]|nr:DUF4430 domain-containing protein [Oscillospiraceae bacterium]
MKNKRNFLVSRILPLVLIAVLALTVVSCGTPSETGDSTPKTFTFEAYDLDGTQLYGGEITTTLATVGDALLEKGLLSGRAGSPGMYIESVCGVVADYNVDRTYWAFYIGGEYAMTGADNTPITEGETYILRRSE